ncbi:hypothetical protein D3C73_853020 [compost metagenome]
MLASKLIDVRATKASKRKMRIRWDAKDRWYVAYFHNSYYRSFGDTMEQAYMAHTRLCCQLT